jgi:hypothetical protein
VCQDELSNISGLASDTPTDPADVGLTRSAAGWLIFLGIIALFYELVVIILRFLNIGIVNSNIKIVIIVVSSNRLGTTGQDFGTVSPKVKYIVFSILSELVVLSDHHFLKAVSVFSSK